MKQRAQKKQIIKRGEIKRPHNTKEQKITKKDEKQDQHKKTRTTKKQTKQNETAKKRN